MNRFQRKTVKLSRRTDSANKLKIIKVDNERIKEVLPPKTKGPFKTDKPMMNRSCNFGPHYKDFAQLTEGFNTDEYQRLLLEQYGFNPALPCSVDQLKELMKVHYGKSANVENSSQYVNPYSNSKTPCNLRASEGSQWQNIECADEIDKYIGNDKDKSESNIVIPQSVRISEIPRIKTIAEKFIKFKKNNIEVRKLDEKVVCIEYDIYKGSDTTKPAQKMRAYFSVKPQEFDKPNGTGVQAEIFSNLQEKFLISDEHLAPLKNKVIEIIDGQVPDNKPYLDDLTRVLKRKQIINTKKNRTSLDLLSLYEMARKDSTPLDDNFSDTNLLSKAELDEIKEIIMTKCTSSVHGISRRTLRKGTQDKDCISGSLVTDLLKEVTA